MKIEHIGIAVSDIEKSKQIYDALFGFSSYKTEEVLSENVLTVFYKTGDSKIELLGGIDTEGVISKFIQKKGEGIHHIAFEVENLSETIDRLKSEGFRFINEIPKNGADNKQIVFIHPKSTQGVLIELCSEKK